MPTEGSGLRKTLIYRRILYHRKFWTTEEQYTTENSSLRKGNFSYTIEGSGLQKDSVLQKNLAHKRTWPTEKSDLQKGLIKQKNSAHRRALNQKDLDYRGIAIAAALERRGCVSLEVSASGTCNLIAESSNSVLRCVLRFLLVRDHRIKRLSSKCDIFRKIIARSFHNSSTCSFKFS